MTIKKMRKNNHIINIIHNNNTQWRDERFLIKIMINIITNNKQQHEIE